VYVLNEPKWVELGYGLIVIRKAADGVSRYSRVCSGVTVRGCLRSCLATWAAWNRA
jgi:hypothetical protein